MEDVTGVTNGDHVTLGHVEFSRYRKVMTSDGNAGVQEVLDARADEVVISDGH